MTVLEVLSLSKSFGGLKAIDSASCRVERKEIVALIGPNGAGKSTLFGAIAGFVKPDAGSVCFEDYGITGLPPHRICERGITSTFQISQPFGRLSVLENVMVGAYHTAPARAQAIALAKDAVRQAGMNPQMQMRASTLTVAGLKRLELARALATRPKLLLLDEVMSGLNPAEVREIVAIVKDIHRSGIAILLIEHVMEAIASLADRIYVLNGGRIIAEGTAAEIAANNAVIEAYLGHGAAERLKAGQPHA
jgi:branched-chain amino acid transport system ATP-binding protein